MTELKPCPFCGGEALLEEGGMFDLVVCKNAVDCGAEGPYGRDCEEAIAAWNTRPAPSPSREGWLTEGLERLAKLGNGDRHGNSEGNVIAQDLLRKLDALTPDALRPAGDEGKAARAAIAVCEAAEKMRGHLAPPQPPAVYFKDESEVIALCEALDRYAALHTEKKEGL
jgi:Lar family restriction alleviation protein